MRDNSTPLEPDPDEHKNKNTDNDKEQGNLLHDLPEWLEESTDHVVGGEASAVEEAQASSSHEPPHPEPPPKVVSGEAQHVYALPKRTKLRSMQKDHVSELEITFEAAKAAKSAHFCTKRVIVSHIKDRRRVVERGFAAPLKNAKQVGCVSQDFEPSVLGPKRCLRCAESALQFSKIWEKKGRSLGVIQPTRPLERSPHAPKFEDWSQEETLGQ